MNRSLPAPWLFLLFAAHVAVWTLYGVLSNPGAIHHDMMEAYLWGHEYQLGYFKHPPFWAWLAGTWFEVFPRSNWAFYLLSSLNSGFALLGIWRLLGLYAKGDLRQASFLLLFATPLYTFLALKFNANAMLLSLWPWTAYFFAKSIERLSLRSAVLFGAFAAASMLSKYYSALLLVCLFAASLFHPNSRRYYRSLAPYLTVLVFLILISPHVYWAIHHGFQTVKYAQTRASFSSATVYRSIVTFILGCIAFHGVVLAINFLSKPGSAATALIDRSRIRYLLVIAFGPFVLTLLLALISHVRLSTNFAIPIFFLVPLALAVLLKPDLSRLRRLARAFTVAIYVLALPIALAVPFIMVQQKKKEFLAPVLDVVELSKQRWAQVTPAPMRVVAGALPYSMAAAFYGNGEVKEFTGFDPNLAPWITLDSIAHTGLLAICLEGDLSCTARASDFLTPASRRETITAARHYGSFTGPSQNFELIIIPPR
jgi:4-amino-4-deoxy-L-arabinose transferase-like glycosyltransferase